LATSLISKNSESVKIVYTEDLPINDVENPYFMYMYNYAVIGLSRMESTYNI